MQKRQFQNTDKTNVDCLERFDKLIMNMSVDEIKNSKCILEQGNHIFFDKQRKFLLYDVDSLSKRALKRFENLKRIIPDANFQESYCDVGCGNGEMPLVAVDLGCKCSVGIDVNPDWAGVKLSERTKAYSRGLYLYKLDLLKEKYEKQFDLVTSYASFEHFKNPAAMLEKMCELVKPDGYLYIEFSPIWRSADGHHQYRHIQFPYYHLVFNEKVINDYYSENGIKDMFFYNKWSAFDYLVLFLRQPQMRVVFFEPHYCYRDYYFVERYQDLFVGYSREDLVVSGFTVVFQRIIDA